MPHATHREVVSGLSKAQLVKVEIPVGFKSYFGVCSVLDIVNEGIWSLANCDLVAEVWGQ